MASNLPEKQLVVYWAGDRAFFSAVRWHDLETVKALRELTGWDVVHPFVRVQADLAKAQDKSTLGAAGIIRNACVGALRAASLVVAYVGTYDTGTAQEIELAKSLGIPVLAWSDAALFRGESAKGGRLINVRQENIDDLETLALPMNAMTTNFDLYIEDSRLATSGLDPKSLAKWIMRGAQTLLSPPAARGRSPP